MKGSFVWLLNADTALEFYDRCLRGEVVTEDEKNEVLLQMYREGLIECLGHTTLSKDEVAAELSKVARVLKIEKRDEKA